MKILIDKQTEIIEVKTLTVYMNGFRLYLKSDEGTGLSITKVSDTSDDEGDLVVNPKHSNQILVS
jgi:hypothetical protein